MSNYTSAYTTPQLGAGEFDNRSIGADMSDAGTNADDELDTLPPAPMPMASTSRKHPQRDGIGVNNDDDHDADVLGPVSYRQTLRLHLHHYQIFLYLGLFTRYETLWSRVASGLTLGAACHGVAAYGCDSVFEWIEDTG